MLDTLKLKAARIEANVSIDELAQKIGLNPTTIYRKFDGKSEFTLREMTELKKILRLDTERFCDIFFGNELAKTQDRRLGNGKGMREGRK